MVKIVLEDKGQDLLWLKVNEGGLVEEAGPFQNEIWKDAYGLSPKSRLQTCMRYPQKHNFAP